MTQETRTELKKLVTKFIMDVDAIPFRGQGEGQREKFTPQDELIAKRITASVRIAAVKMFKEVTNDVKEIQS
jgi:hypothetical protein